MNSRAGIALPGGFAAEYSNAMRKQHIDTPALILDLDVAEANIAGMASYFRDRPQKLRPHFKTPKTSEIARRQLAAGAIGITVSKLGEAEVLARAGLGPVLLANQIAGAAKIDRLFAISSRIPIIATVESEFNIQELEAGAKRAARSIDAIVEVDTGMHRCGTESPEETVELARRLSRGALRYRGVMGYEGHAVLIPDAEQRAKFAHEALTTLSRHVDALRSGGLAPEIVSAGGTGTYDIAGSWPDVTEVQAGSYVFMDGAYRRVRPDLGQPALTLLATVISRRGNHAIIDAGMKSLTNEFGPPRGKDLPVKVTGLSEEHGHLDCGGADIAPGMKMELVPSHNDTTINLHTEYNVVRGDEVIAVWPIEAARAYR
ncbi:MAG TPA: DSD1 family PLP-dependent enzyme [Candidatus Binataceae bacterium]|nr:DSD1 family PLP-dependent enzyme [Candidatus Binataceae bacterium]